ncbi:5-formyltetrahydrofolate cyclo-ligase [Lacinutrix salivirga]
MTKKELRIKYKKLRQDLSLQEIDDLSLLIANEALKLPIWEFSFYHIFLSIETQKEVNTDYILNILSGKDKNIVVSKSDFETGLLHNFLLNDATKLSLNAYNIPEPVNGIPIANKTVEVVFIPLLAFDLKGNRVGYGKGFYDKFLATCKPETIKIGLSFFEAEDSLIDTLSTDIPLHYCVTPKRLYTF